MNASLRAIFWAALFAGFTQAAQSIAMMMGDGLEWGEYKIVGLVSLFGFLGGIVPSLKETRPSIVPAVVWSVIGGVIPPVAAAGAGMAVDGLSGGELRLLASTAVLGLMNGLALYFRPEPRDPTARQRETDPPRVVV